MPPGTSVQDLKWNPALGSMVAVCLSDGSMMVLDVTDRVTMQAQLPAANGITCSESEATQRSLRVLSSVIPELRFECDW